MIRELFERYENIEGPGALPHITGQSWELPRIPGEIIYSTKLRRIELKGLKNLCPG